jgi:hypothetical protein
MGRLVGLLEDEGGATGAQYALILAIVGFAGALAIAALQGKWFEPAPGFDAPVAAQSSSPPTGSAPQSTAAASQGHAENRPRRRTVRRAALASHHGRIGQNAPAPAPGPARGPGAPTAAGDTVRIEG